MYLLLVVALGVATYACAIALLRTTGDGRRRSVLVCGLTAIVGVLASFKYAHFFAETVNDVARVPIVPLPHIVVPLAISFFTFEFVHVLVDVYLRKISKIGALDFAVFTMFFPTLVAGPIKRFPGFATQLHPIVAPVPADVALYVYRIMIGLAKKTIVADSMSVFAQPLVAPGSPYGRADYWIAVVAFSVKIYFDFSGYSDIAIGTAGLLGVRVPENFNRPYWALNIADFWGRWHISLSAWVRDYIFIPLGGSRREPIIVAFNLLTAMAISGLWHGAAWTFVFWGLWHGIGLIVHRVWAANVVSRSSLLASGGTPVRVASIGATFAFVALGWVLFAASSLPAAGRVYAGLVAP